MGSERLPGKVLKEVNGIPIIHYTLKRLSKSKYIDNIVLATSDKDIDIPLVNYIRNLGFIVFRGSEDNVLERYKLASDKYSGDIIVRITGDCPLIDPIIIDNVITKYLMYDYDYIRLDVPNSFIRGFDVEVFSKEALNRVYSTINSRENEKFDKYKEHVTYYMYTHQNDFKIGYVKGEDFYNKDYRLCVDTKEDFSVVKTIYEKFADIYVSAEAVVQFLDQNEDISKININIRQKK